MYDTYFVLQLLISILTFIINEYRYRNNISNTKQQQKGTFIFHLF